MPASKFLLPHKIELPWGYTIKVVQLERGHEFLDGLYAGWDVDTRTIAIDKSYSIGEKRGLLLHELQHAFADFTLWAAHHVGIVVVPDAIPHDPTEEEDTSGEE